MNKSLVKSAIAGGVIVFIWMVISWTVLPWHKSGMQFFSNPNQVAKVITENTRDGGLYFLPAQSNNSEVKPYIFTVVRPEGMDYNSFKPLAISLVIQLIAAYIIAWLVSQTKGFNYRKKVTFITVMGLFAAIVGELPAWNWMGYPAVATLLMMLDLVIAWFLAGLAMGKLLKK